MENNKVFNIKGLYSLSTFELLSKAVVTFLFILLTISVATTDGLAITCITLIICVILLVVLYCSYKNYVDFGKTGIIVDIENNREDFIYGKDKLLESKENPYDITERLKKSYKED